MGFTNLNYTHLNNIQTYVFYALYIWHMITDKSKPYIANCRHVTTLKSLLVNLNSYIKQLDLYL